MNERRDDWRSGVDENLVALNTAQRVTDKQIDDLELSYEAVDKILRGDPDKETDGLVARYHTQENLLKQLEGEINRLRQDIHGYPDKSPGILKRLDRVEGKSEFKEKRWAMAWSSWTAIIVALIPAIFLLIREWPDIKRKWQEQRRDPLGKMIEKAKKPKTIRKSPRPRPAPVLSPTPESVNKSE